MVTTCALSTRGLSEHSHMTLYCAQFVNGDQQQVLKVYDFII